MKGKIRNKRLFAISVIVLLVISILVLALPVFAQTALPGYTPVPDRPTWTEVAVSPDFVGVGQEVTINIMTYPGPSGPTYEAQFLVPELHGGFEDITITINHPDGEVETFMPIDETLAQVGIDIPGQAQIVGHLQFKYTPTKVGEYSMTASFPGDFYTTDNIYEPAKLSVYYEPSESTKPAILTVQQERVVESGLLTGWPWSPLPEGYWENPVQTDNREWYEVSGDWLQKGWDSAASKYNLFSTAPESPHIVWAKELWDGGLPGGIWGSLPYQSTGYFYYSPIVMDGNIYLNTRNGYFECINLRTGETLWEAEGSVDLGQTMDPAFQTHSQQAEGYIDRWLWGGTSPSRSGTGSDKWYMYDPFDGDLIRTITNVPQDISGSRFQDGSPIVWCVQANLAEWNTTEPMKIPYCNLIKWDYSEVTGNDWRTGIVWNVSAKTDDIVSVGDNNFRGPNVYPFYGANVVVVKTPNAMQHALGFDMTTGALLWKNYNMVHDIDVLYEGIATSPSGPLIKQNSGAPEWVAYDVKTGQEIWRAPTGELPWAMLPSYECVFHDGVHFLGSYDGHVYAYDTNTGEQVWVSDYMGEKWETIYGNQPLTAYSTAGADGKLYFASNNIYRMMPRTRFHELVCIDESNGDFIWRLPIGIECSAIADGYLVGHDQDNGILYSIGRGKTQTTVTTSPKVTANGNRVLIEGTIMDMSPGAPNTPAVSEEDMSMWMDYLYGQNATLINNTPTPRGVPVKLAYQNSDGTWTDINEAISDDHGNFGLEWTPPEEGTYHIKAFYLGSESYYGSSATTFLTVGPAPSASGQIEPAPLLSTEMIIITIVAIIAAVGLAGYIILKKRQ